MAAKSCLLVVCQPSFDKFVVSAQFAKALTTNKISTRGYDLGKRFESSMGFFWMTWCNEAIERLKPE